ncbi:hypothetical protein DVK07_09080 [Halorubrum sp. Atlit-26R]|nr:hypothetical protein DVK07_09080 [Halorubrum sp. Atlit-26R]
MPTSARQGASRTREGRGDRSEAEGAARLGRREAACGRVPVSEASGSAEVAARAANAVSEQDRLPTVG